MSVHWTAEFAVVGPHERIHDFVKQMQGKKIRVEEHAPGYATVKGYPAQRGGITPYLIDYLAESFPELVFAGILWQWPADENWGDPGSNYAVFVARNNDVDIGEIEYCCCDAGRWAAEAEDDGKDEEQEQEGGHLRSMMPDASNAKIGGA
jgi:hypothetical protein